MLWYIQHVSSVYAYASKAFDLVRHGILFELLLSRGLPSLVVRLLHSWYVSKHLRVRWGGAFSSPLLSPMEFVKVAFCLQFLLGVVAC